MTTEDGAYAAAVEEMAGTVQELRSVGGGSAGDRGSAVDGVRRARELRDQADRVLAAAVALARANGGTWQEIGDVLGTSRQAAFQRFGRPVDPRTGEEMDRTTTPGAAERATEVFALLAAGRGEGVFAAFDERMAEAVGVQELGDVWAQVVAAVGTYEGPGEALARRMGPHTVVDVPLEFEAGRMTGRVTFHPDLRIAGLYVLTPEAAGSL